MSEELKTQEEVDEEGRKILENLQEIESEHVEGEYGADQIQILDILRPVECIRQLGESSFDLSVNCAEIPGAETINILATIIIK